MNGPGTNFENWLLFVGKIIVGALLVLAAIGSIQAYINGDRLF